MEYVIKLKVYPKKDFNKKPLQNNEYINAKIKIYNNVMHTEFKYKKNNKK